VDHVYCKKLPVAVARVVEIDAKARLQSNISQVQTDDIKVDDFGDLLLQV